MAAVNGYQIVAIKAAMIQVSFSEANVGAKQRTNERKE